MSRETDKLMAVLSPEERAAWFAGSVIDIGAGDSPVVPHAKVFDVADGDANRVLDYVDGQFDCVYSSHCLEHMYDAYCALADWWQLVKPGGWLVVTVPDEDLYEQGAWPSRYNADHKWTFTLSKRSSWSPRSVNVMQLAKTLEGGDVQAVELQDAGYDRSLRGVDQTRRPGVLAQIMLVVRKRG
jgi:SAM-dependent methyltransferase